MLLFVNLGTPSFKGSEDRFAEITREMILTQDFFHPTINGEPHFHKPLGSYWTIALAAAVTGGLNELATRAPSALAGLIALIATFLLAKHAFGSTCAIVACWLLLTTYGFLFWSRMAAADAANMAAVIAAVAWFRIGERNSGLLFYTVFFSICAVGAQFKGVATLVLPVVALVPWLVRDARWRSHANPTLLVPAACAAGVLYLAPFGLAAVTSPANAVPGETPSGLFMVFQENILRFFAPHDHKGPFYTYFGALPVLLLPWSLVFVGAIVHVGRAYKELDEDSLWVWKCVALIFLLFTASGSRRSYYILPILPFCAMAIATALVRRDELVSKTLALTTAMLILAGAIELGSAFAAPAMGWGLGVEIPTMLVLSAATAGALVLGLWRWRRRLQPWLGGALGVEGQVAVPIVISVVLFGAYFCFQYPALDSFRTEKPFALQVRKAVGEMPHDRIAFIRHVPALFPFYLDLEGPARQLQNSNELTQFLREGPGAVIASPRTLAKLDGTLPDDLARSPDISEQIYSWESHYRRFGAWIILGADPLQPSERASRSTSKEPASSVAK